jgi:hypothetical protein
VKAEEPHEQEPAPPSRTPARGEARRGSKKRRTRRGRRICIEPPPEHLEQRREPPTPKASPATPPPPQRRRQAPHAHLTMYTPGSIDSPPSRRRSGRGGRGISRIAGGELGSTENAQKSPFITVDGDKGGGSGALVWDYKDIIN